MEILRQAYFERASTGPAGQEHDDPARTEDFRRTLKTAPVNLAELIHKVIEQVRPFLKARRLKLMMELDDDLGSFELDADKIAQCSST